MLNSDFLVIDFEGFRHKSQQFIPKEISVRGANYQDTTILLQPPVEISLLTEENLRLVNRQPTRHCLRSRELRSHIHFQFLHRAQTLQKVPRIELS